MLYFSDPNTFSIGSVNFIFDFIFLFCFWSVFSVGLWYKFHCSVAAFSSIAVTVIIKRLIDWIFYQNVPVGGDVRIFTCAFRVYKIKICFQKSGSHPDSFTFTFEQVKPPTPLHITFLLTFIKLIAGTLHLMSIGCHPPPHTSLRMEDPLLCFIGPLAPFLHLYVTIVYI